jgi:hypothetical protein
VYKRTIALLLIVIVLACSAVACKTSEGDAAELRKSIERLLPTGSSYDSVIRFMEQQGITYADAKEVEGYDPGLKYGRHSVLTGTRVRTLFTIEQSRVEVAFYFNEDRQLTGSVVRP